MMFRRISIIYVTQCSAFWYLVTTTTTICVLLITGRLIV